MKFESQIQKNQCPQRRKSHGIAHDLGLDHLTDHLSQYIEERKSCCQRVIRRQKLKQCPREQNRSGSKERQKIKNRHQHTEQECILDSQNQKPGDQDSTYDKHNTELGKKIAANQFFDIVF